MEYADFISEASRILRTSSVAVERIIISAPYRYKHYTIPKRTGGLRDIHHPSPALKAMQRWIVGNILNTLPVHDCVYSYREGRNIGMHAAQHSRSNYISRFDFADFFPSITGGLVRSFLVDVMRGGSLSFGDELLHAIIRLVCRHEASSNSLVLSIGAPSSPHLSNAILYGFDSDMAAIAERMGGVYTRYADDIYISNTSKESIEAMEVAFFETFARRLPYLKVNKKKTQRLSRKRRMSVTGVNITPQRRLSVGRDLKRSLKTQVFLATRGKLPLDEMSVLTGMLAHVRSIEPTFIEILVRKFGADSMRLLMGPSVKNVALGQDLAERSDK